MAIRARKRHPLTRFVGPLAAMMILGYFGFHAFNGDYGIRAHLAMQTQITRLEGELAHHTAQRDRLEARVALLRDGQLEKDMVDQWVRGQLNMAREDEIVILRP
ncbi:MAG: septum formation initiator family protein [Pseudomonadota bacterium]